jgi:hypothetical protein
MSDQDELSGGDQYEAAAQAAKLAEIKEKLLEVKGMATSEDGKDYPVNSLEVQVRAMRNAISGILRVVNAKAHAEYKAMKKADHSLTGKRKAYVFAFTKLLEQGYNISGF